MLLLEERVLEETSTEKENKQDSANHKDTRAPREENRDWRRCRTCGRPRHLERDCRMVICNGCGKIGHIERDCWIKYPKKRPNDFNYESRGPSHRNDYTRNDFRNDYTRNDSNPRNNYQRPDY